MTTQLTTEIDGGALVAEIERYLAAVDAFRAEGREPSWLAESSTATHRRKRKDAGS